MKKIFVVQITLLILVAGGLSGMFLFTDVYSDVRSTIVSTVCLSCIKMDPLYTDFTFQTANGLPHPVFVLENLTKGPVFIEYRQDVCKACDDMAPLVKEILGIDFGKTETFYKTIKIGNNNVTFIHINHDHVSKELDDSFYIYDKNNVGGVPMFVFITLGNNSGHIEPYYATAYGTLTLSNNEARKAFLRNMLQDAIDHYNENIMGYIE